MYSKILRLRFPKSMANQPIMCNLAKKYDLIFNIFQATIFPRKEGLMVVELHGHRKNFTSGVKFLKEMGVKVETVAQDMRRKEDLCFQCGVCTSICPTGALYIKRPEMEVVFDRKKCTACELCIAVCPPRAMQATFNPVTAL